jgi:tRNA threonylcarbamoyladenosine biosynthesis protein TsaB
MLILGIDTSNAYSSVAIFNGSEILWAYKDRQENVQAEKLISTIESALEGLGVKYKDLDYIAASIGPGSFTGIRIGLAAASGFGVALDNVETVSVSNFETINFRIKQQYRGYDYAISVVNAYRNQLYMQVFSKKNILEAGIYDLEDAKKLISSLDGVVVIAGSGCEKLYSVTKMPEGNIILLPRFAYPDARFICRVAHKKIIKSDNLKPDLNPLYIRMPDAKRPAPII